jgi:hypothetical protein
MRTPRRISAVMLSTVAESRPHLGRKQALDRGIHVLHSGGSVFPVRACR